MISNTDGFRATLFHCHKEKSMDLVSFYQNVLCLPAPWYVERVECFADAKRVDVWIKHRESRFHCPECMGEYAVHDHLPERTWRHLDTCGYQTFLHARLPRVKCALDGKVTAWVPFATPQTSVTEEMECRCIMAMQECTMQGAESLTGVSVRKLERIRSLAVERGLGRREEQPLSRIGIDEKQVFARHKYFTVICDQKARSVYDVIDSRKTEAVSPWFEANKAILHDVETAAMDMSAGYASVIGGCLPNAAVCFDKFHVVQIMNKAVDATRKEEQKSLPDARRKLMFGSRYCFLYARENLPAKYRDKFDEVAALATKTSRAWAIKEALRDALSLALPDFEPAFKKWHWWATHSRLEAVRKAAKTLKSHLHGIMNAVEYGVTNALAEGLNSKIEAIKRAACGYRSKSRFRIAILFHCGKLDLMPKLTT